MSLKLSDSQQYFLQLMLNKAVIDELNFKNTFCQVMKKFNIAYNEATIKDQYAKFLKEINDVIKTFSLEIRKGVDELTGVTFFCLVRQSDAGGIGNLSSLYNPVELNIYKRILSLIIESDDGYVDYNTLINQVRFFFIFQDPSNCKFEPEKYFLAVFLYVKMVFN